MTPIIHGGWVEFDSLASALRASEHVCLRVMAVQGLVTCADERYVRTSRDEYLVTIKDYIVLRQLLGSEPPAPHVEDANRHGHLVDISRWEVFDD